MRYSNFSLMLTVAASIGFLTACSGGGTSLPVAAQPAADSSQTTLGAQILSVPNNARTSTSPDVNARLVYVCGSNQCIWYRMGSNNPAGTITGLNNPGGIGVDKNGNVYVAEAGASDVLLYGKGSPNLLKTLADPGQIPNDVAISSSDGTVYVTNNSSSGQGSVAVYAHGSTTPTSTITDPNFGTVVSLALGKNGTLYVCYAAGPNGQCDKFPHAKGTGINILSFSGIPTGVAIDGAGRIVVNNGFGTTSVYSDSGSADSGAILAVCNSIAESGFPTGLAFDNAHDDFFVVHYFNANITEEEYPGCVGSPTLEFTYSTGWSSSIVPQGVAVDGPSK